MKCLSCNTNLTDYENSLKLVMSHEYVQMCSNCLPSSVVVYGNESLITNEDLNYNYDDVGYLDDSDMKFLK